MADTENMRVDPYVMNIGFGAKVMKTAMKRYRPGGRHCRELHDPGYILLFAHGVGFHKEHWQPTIEHLFQHDVANRSPTRILETWAIDWPNHGEAAGLNDELFLGRPDIQLTVHDYAEAFATLYRSGLLGKIEKGVQKVVLIGHSAGAIAVIFTTTLFGPSSAVPFDMVVLVEPAWFMSNKDMASQTTDMFKLVQNSISSRRYRWDTKEAAYEWMKVRVPWKFWDPSVLKLYSEYGLRALPAPFYTERDGVALVCSPAHEAAAFNDHPESERVLGHLNSICGVIPFHVILGARNDMFSREVQDTIPDPSAGRIIASITRVEKAGHLVVQERPKQLADVFRAILNYSKENSNDRALTKL